MQPSVGSKRIASRMKDRGKIKGEAKKVFGNRIEGICSCFSDGIKRTVGRFVDSWARFEFIANKKEIFF